MREPVSLAYLLARASDTLADTAEVPVDLRVSCLEKFTKSLKDHKVRDELLELIKQKFVSYQQLPKERILLERLGEVFDWYDTVRDWAWKAIDEVMQPICAGQMNDLRHFGAVEGLTKLDSAEDLELYCYQVAGSVGEFWSSVGYHAYHRFSNLGRDELDRLGREYGKGLQLVNILRDLDEDYRNGRCYLPVNRVEDEVEREHAAQKWRNQARDYIASGKAYAASLSQWRVRTATVLPALIAEQTLDLLDSATRDDLAAGVKIDRKEVRRCLWQAMIYRYEPV